MPILLNAHPGTKYGIPFPVLRALVVRHHGREHSRGAARDRRVRLVRHPDLHRRRGGQDLRRRALARLRRRSAAASACSASSLPSAITFLDLLGAQHLHHLPRHERGARVRELGRAAGAGDGRRAARLGRVDAPAASGRCSTQPSQFATFGEFWKVFVPSLTGMIGFWATLVAQHPRLHALRQGPARADARPDARPADDDDRVLGDGRGHHQRVAGDPARASTLEKLWDPVFILAQLTSPRRRPGTDRAAASRRPATRARRRDRRAVRRRRSRRVSVNIAANVVEPGERLRQPRAAADLASRPAASSPASLGIADDAVEAARRAPARTSSTG